MATLQPSARPISPGLESALSLIANNPMQPTTACDEPVTPEEIASLINVDRVKKVAGYVASGRSTRRLLQSIEQNESNLRTLCQTVFYSYLPKEARTETLGKIFQTKYLKLDPETKIDMYEKWLAELPYHQFTDLTSMTINPKIERGLFALPPEIAKFSHLTKLSFSDWLQSLPEELKRLPSLTTLDLRLYFGGNQDLENFKEICRALPHLKKIILSDPRQEHSAEIITRFPSPCSEMLQRDFPHIKVEFEAIPKPSWNPC